MLGSRWIGHWIGRRKLVELRGFVTIIFAELLRTRAFVEAAALAFYFLLSLPPLLIFASALLGYLPIPHIFDQLLDLMATLVPADAMALVQKVIVQVLVPHRGGLLSFGLLGSLWAASGGFSSMIEALNIAYDVQVGRAWWGDRVRALVLTLTTGAFSMISLFALMAGPHFGRFLETFLPIPHSFALAWPALRWVITFLTFVLGVIMLYYWGPNRKQTVHSTIPGAIIAVAVWFLGSALLGMYLSRFANYNKTYGSLGALMGLMLWFYLIALAMILGAECNAEFAKRRLAARGVGPVDPFDRPMPGISTA